MTKKKKDEDKNKNEEASDGGANTRIGGGVHRAIVAVCDITKGLFSELPVSVHTFCEA